MKKTIYFNNIYFILSLLAFAVLISKKISVNVFMLFVLAAYLEKCHKQEYEINNNSIINCTVICIYTLIWILNHDNLFIKQLNIYIAILFSLIFFVFSLYFIIVLSCAIKEKLDNLVKHKECDLLIKIVAIATPALHTLRYTFFTYIFSDFELLRKIDDRLIILMRILFILYWINIVYNKKTIEHIKQFAVIALFSSVLFSVIVNGFFSKEIFNLYFSELEILNYFNVIVISYFVGEIIRISNSELELKIFIYILYLSVTILSIYIILTVVFHVIIDPRLYFADNYLNIKGVNPNQIGSQFAGVILLYTFLIFSRNKINVWDIFSFLINYYVVVLTNSRASKFSLLIGFFFLIYIFLRKKESNIIKSLVISALATFCLYKADVVVFYTLNHAQKLFGDGKLGMVQVRKLLKKDRITSGRTTIWIKSLKLYLSSPVSIVFGKTREQMLYTHNQILEILCCWGIPALLSFFVINVLVLISAYYGILNREYNKLSIIVVYFSILLNNMMEAVLLYHNFPLSIIFFIIAGYIVSGKWTLLKQNSRIVE